MQQKIIEYLRSKYSPKAIILHGSRVNGLNRPNSDWDLILLLDSEIEAKTEIFERQSLDIEVLCELPKVEDFLRTHGPILQRASVLFDNQEGLGESFVNSVQQALAKGKNLTQQEYDNRFLRISRVLDKMLGSQQIPELFFMHAGVFVELCHRFWFEFKSEWSQPPYLGFPQIKKEDPAFYSLLSGISQETRQPRRMKYAFELYKKLFPKEFKTHPSIEALEKIEANKES